MEEICANCVHYKGGDDPDCRKGNKYWGYLRHMKCFNTSADKMSNQGNKPNHFIKDGVEMKVCKGCLQELPLSKFSKNHSNSDGLQGLCNHCFHIKYVLKKKQNGNIQI